MRLQSLLTGALMEAACSVIVRADCYRIDEPIP